MEFFEVIHKRRSIRRFTDEKVDPEAIEKALQAALLAPTSSNAQTWDFYWAVKPETKKKLAYYCLNQSAARTAADLIVVTA
ncbi:MAG: nitroreductase family protein, partial [Bdellovibrionaceae bacterium]|nr:nitroreductase family protein [Pseudobdellovibrionaceae bacterium]